MIDADYSRYVRLVEDWLTPSGAPPVVTQVIQDQELTVIVTDRAAALCGPETIAAIRGMTS